MMNIPKFSKWPVLMACLGLMIASTKVGADDIDIFVGSGGSAQAPNVIFLVDNSPNWSRQAQKWPDNGGTQGVAELAAIRSVLNTIKPSDPINVGLAFLSEYAGTSAGGATPGRGGGYIRFGARDMTVAANRTALQNILAGIAANITDPNEKVGGMAQKDENAGLYEVYKYLSGLAPFTGTAAQNVNADIANNSRTYTASGQGLTSGFAQANGKYISPITSANPCAKTFIIYIANNANNTGYEGQASYQPSVATAGSPLVATSGLDTWTDEWTKYLYSSGVVVPAGNTNGSVVTYVLDAYNAQRNVGYSNSLINAAKMGGGRYFQVGSEEAILAALSTIFAEIQGVNSTFASSSLPVNTTNRSQNKNQVFIPMFRPDSAAAPRWMGNLKQYQFINTGSDVDLGDASGYPAVSPLTGYPADCAVSFWTTDSPYRMPGAPSGTSNVPYWSLVPENPVPKGRCPTGGSASATSTPFDPFSDAPDGPFVEKGGVAEVIRKGNLPSVTNGSPTWQVNRKVLTLSGGSLVSFSTATSGLSSTVVDFIRGKDTNDENSNGNTTETRPSIHGDTVHSRPTPVDYGGTTGVTAYYGTNDGNLRAVDTNDGRERWAFVAPEFFSTLERLQTNLPLINYPGMPSGITPTPTRKDYYFDGSIGLYQNADNSKVWIYPTMRRGGRVVYGLDVTNPENPVFKWKVGCPSLTSDTGCTSGFNGMGQSWSAPKVAPSIKGYSGAVVVFGGGYDNCEDANTSTPACSSTKGAGVYIVDADTGTLIKSFSTTRAVASDVILIGINDPGIVDHAYVADLGGNIYRIDFGADTSQWTMNRIAYTNGAGRKFFYPPALLPAPGNKVYLAIGSGDREHPLQAHYPYDGVTNRFYVFLDDLSVTTATNMDDSSVMNNYTAVTSCETAGILPGGSLKGWFMDLNQYGQGEQTVTSALILGGMAIFSTNRPVPAAPGSCSSTLGEARGYWVNLFNGSGGIGTLGSCGGTRSSIFVGGGLPPSPVFSKVVVGGKLKGVLIGGAARNGGVSTTIGGQEFRPPTPKKRKIIYWKSSGQN